MFGIHPLHTVNAKTFWILATYCKHICRHIPHKKICNLRSGSGRPINYGSSTDADPVRTFFAIEKNMLSSTVLRIRDVYPGSRILIFTHPGSRISDPGS